MLLVLNTGSSSIKAALFRPDLTEVLSGHVAGIGQKQGAELALGETSRAVAAPDHKAALAAFLSALEEAGAGEVTAAAHRVVHGGAELTAPVRLTPEAIRVIEANVPLAPLHNPPGLAGIEAMRDARPDLPQFASFDTAFHATQSEVATAYAIPKALRDKGIRRYGFHGLSYAGMVAQFGAALPRRLLALHLGAGVSLCAIREGRSVATTMGYSPLSGPTMATRSGDIDGMAVLRLAEETGIEEAGRVLNRDSGLKGLGGTADMRRLLASDAPEARFAVDHFVWTVVEQAGRLIAAMDGVDAVAFTGGIGENAGEIRDRVMARLAWLGELPVHVVPAEEERQIARDAFALMG
ncbi:acetate kinase [Psychromarinibacter sp. C21-152]|uniref:Acetate kinase n=1 Tax=Psychromarinibacter sediminicola TaxID=3033385 RepID=A0AAE3T8X1_9RHOB|nr:acetate kinase [Psychromarinibacter sediminicola]MDF0601880.1 acetate kinase [Psychromarinibacter sediminicola]